MDEKPKLEHHEAAEDPYAGLTPGDAECWRRFEGKEGKKVVRKVCSITLSHVLTITHIHLLQVDLRLISVLGLLYLLSHIDRGNIGNAKIEGMDKDIGLTGNQYNIASTIFLVPYILFGTQLRKQTKFEILMVSRDPIKHHHQEDTTQLVVDGFGFVLGHSDDYDGRGQKLPRHDDMPCDAWFVRGKRRAGVNESYILTSDKAGFFPGAVFLVSSWYPRYELQQRLAIFYTASAFSGALSGLLAFAIAQMDGLRGVEGWRWIFLIEGAVTITAGLAMPFLIPDTPELASWLSPDEKKFIDL